ncbi:MAG: hypothetical protein CMM46_13390 [Rhodospirillaceae bacterium]|nr:hypothetical protein [Rhodospirillaceae bacterium]
MCTESLRNDPRQALDNGDLTLRSLRVFVAVEEAGSMALAAGRLGTSASAVTQQVSNLEQVLGARLFDRAVRPIALTDPGGIVAAGPRPPDSRCCRRSPCGDDGA